MTYPAVEQLLSHRGKMLLIDKVVAFDKESLCSQVTVRDDGLFGDGISVPAWLGMEYMAQTIGAYQGMIDSIANRPIQVGFLLGTRRYNSQIESFKVGAVLTIEVSKVMQDQSGLGVFECKISDSNTLVEANINVYQPNS